MKIADTQETQTQRDNARERRPSQDRNNPDYKAETPRIPGQLDNTEIPRTSTPSITSKRPLQLHLEVPKVSQTGLDLRFLQESKDPFFHFNGYEDFVNKTTTSSGKVSQNDMKQVWTTIRNLLLRYGQTAKDYNAMVAKYENTKQKLEEANAQVNIMESQEVPPLPRADAAELQELRDKAQTWEQNSKYWKEEAEKLEGYIQGPTGWVVKRNNLRKQVSEVTQNLHVRNHELQVAKTQIEQLKRGRTPHFDEEAERRKRLAPSQSPEPESLQRPAHGYPFDAEFFANGNPARDPNNRFQRQPSHATHHTSASRPHTTTSRGSGRPVRIPDPAMFTGNRDKYAQWKLQIKNKLAHITVDLEESGGDYAAVNYITSRLDGKAFNVVEPRLKSLHSTLTVFHRTADDVFTALNAHFDEPDRKRKALAEYSAMKQGPNEPFAEFFNRYKSCALILSKDKESATHDFINMLNSRFYSKIEMDISTTWTSVQQVRAACQRLEISFKHVDGRKGSSSNVGSVSLKPSRRNDRSTSYRNNRGGKSSSTSFTEELPARGSDGRIPLPSRLRKLDPLSSEDKKRLAAEGRCWGCREIGHHSSDPQCLARRWQEANRAGKTTNNQIQVAEMGLEDEVEPESQGMDEEQFEEELNHLYDSSSDDDEPEN
ncbi:hypothetical protein OHC33_005678 [Knufia fluminis]|uniref:Gag protein n=1 Tax=Knufia fluminis TaxID=191047 RepID=A0AAN8EFS9_9EURO|nr:hypothetical protein OHC33_005678 [Knufia fluminis]